MTAFLPHAFTQNAKTILAALSVLTIALLITLLLPMTESTSTTINAISPTPETADASAAAEASAAAAATETASVASPAAEVTEQLEEKQGQDITQPGETQRSRLAAFLDENPPGPLSWYNFGQHAIRRAVTNGLPANIIVLVLLFPVITSIIAFSRHIIGLKGFGVYIPAVLSVAFVSTGIVTGVTIFGGVLLSAVLMHRLVKQLKLPYLPRTAMLLLGVSVLVLCLLFLAAEFGLVSFLSISIFPLLIIILLTENFMESQLFKSQSASLRLLLETLLIALLCSLFIGMESIQRFVLIYPELTLLSVAATNYAIGNYTGLRLLEYMRFKELLSSS